MRIRFLSAVRARRAAAGCRGGRRRAGAPATLAASRAGFRAADQTVDAPIRDHSLVVRDIQADALVAGRSRERFEQYTRSGRIVGGDVTRLGAPDGTVSLFGTLHTDLALNLTPALSRGRG